MARQKKWKHFISLNSEAYKGDVPNNEWVGSIQLLLLLCCTGNGSLLQDFITIPSFTKSGKLDRLLLSWSEVCTYVLYIAANNLVSTLAASITLFPWLVSVETMHGFQIRAEAIWGRLLIKIISHTLGAPYMVSAKCMCSGADRGINSRADSISLAYEVASGANWGRKQIEGGNKSRVERFQGNAVFKM